MAPAAVDLSQFANASFAAIPRETAGLMMECSGRDERQDSDQHP